MQWFDVCHEENPEKALGVFMKSFMGIADQHVPMRKWSARSKCALWLNDEMRSLMVQRDDAKKTADRTGSLCDKQHYCKLRNAVTKLNKCRKREYYMQEISDTKNDEKEIMENIE